MESNVQKYLQLRAKLKKARQQESELLEKMDLIWQAMSMEERQEVQSLNPSWPPPVLEPLEKNEDDNGNG